MTSPLFLTPTPNPRAQHTHRLHPVVVDVAHVIDQHRETGRDCKCGAWPVGLEHAEHVALALQGAGLIGYQPREGM